MSNTTALANAFPFECGEALKRHARELRRPTWPAVDPRAETVRIINSKHKAA